MRLFLNRAIIFANEEDGPTATEYAVLLAVISITVMIAMSAFGQRMSSIYVAIDQTAGAAAAGS